MVKIICLGNEFLEEDCFAKEVGSLLRTEFKVVNIKDSFELMGVLSEVGGVGRSEVGGEFVILDVVEGLDEVVKLRVEDLRADSIVSAHDFDAVYVLKLLESSVDIIGIPMRGDAKQIASLVERKIRDFTGRSSNL